MLNQLQVRLKAVVALLGGVLTWLYAVQITNPNKYVTGAILLLTVLGVHQAPNKE